MRLLRVEDDRELSARLIRRLSDEGYLVEQVGDGERALCVFRANVTADSNRT